MKMPKKHISKFIQFDEFDCRQVNLSIGRKYNYWFIEPNLKPFKLLKNVIPAMLLRFENEFKEYLK